MSSFLIKVLFGSVLNFKRTTHANVTSQEATPFFPENESKKPGLRGPSEVIWTKDLAAGFWVLKEKFRAKRPSSQSMVPNTPSKAKSSRHKPSCFSTETRGPGSKEKFTSTSLLTLKGGPSERALELCVHLYNEKDVHRRESHSLAARGSASPANSSAGAQTANGCPN